MSGLISGRKRLESWSQNSDGEKLGYYEARGLIQRLFQKLKLQTKPVLGLLILNED